jgi:hypothetical protein
MKIWGTKVEVKINRRDFLQKLGSVSGMLAGVMFLPKLLVKVPPEPTPDPSPTPDPTPTPPINPNLHYLRDDGRYVPAKEVFNDKFKYPNTLYHPADGSPIPIDPGHKHAIHPMGYGACSMNDGCQGFVPNSGYPNMCANCGHNYTLHW